MTDTFVVLSRDPFSREDLIRQTEATTQDCAWCGQRRKGGRLFNYGRWLANGHTYWQAQLFCSVDCMRNYHG